MKRFLALFIAIMLTMTMISLAGAESCTSTTLMGAGMAAGQKDGEQARAVAPRGKTFRAFLFWEGSRLYDTENGNILNKMTLKHGANFRVQVVSGSSWLKATTAKLPYAKKNNTSVARTGRVVYRDNKGVVATFIVTQTGRYNITYFGQIVQPVEGIQIRWTGSKSKMKVNYAMVMISENDFKTYKGFKTGAAVSPAVGRYTGRIAARRWYMGTVMPVRKMGGKYISGQYITQIGAVYVDKIGVYKKGVIYKASPNQYLFVKK